MTTKVFEFLSNECHYLGRAVKVSASDSDSLTGCLSSDSSLASRYFAKRGRIGVSLAGNKLKLMSSCEIVHLNKFEI